MPRKTVISMTILTLLLPMLAITATLAADPETEDQKLLYALGVALASKVPAFDLTPEEASMVQAGITDGLEGADPKVDMATYAAKLDAFVRGRMTAVADREKAAGVTFRDKMAAEEGVVKTDSGMLYVEITPGTGDQPTANDKVKIHYHGTLTDGKVFDSSVDRGEPVEFALSGVVPCFSEGLSQMKAGGKSKIVCPPELAYGDRGQGGIKPGATILFEIELLEVIKPAAAASPTP